ncbi:MAG: dihydroxyacetone kinase phosphoryl donor subunit DhaM [Terracoccus sp.]
MGVDDTALHRTREGPHLSAGPPSPPGRVGIVVVSHSPRLAQAAVDLALQMVVGQRPPIAIAAGAGDDVIGTDAVRIADAIATVASDHGVLVLMDLGSALLSSELALELLEEPAPPVRLSSAPFVEGLLAAVVLAASGASLDEVDRGAVAALDAKSSQLSNATEPDAVPGSPDVAAADATAEVTLVNRDGLHARPAAAVVALVAPFEATVTVTNLRTGVGPMSARTPIGLASLAARMSDTIRVEATGSDARSAVEALRDLVANGFGEEPSTGAAALATDSGAGVGVGVSPGRVIGRAVVLPPPALEPDQPRAVPPSDRPAEADRAAVAATGVASDLHALASSLRGEARSILSALAAMAQDPHLISTVRAGVIDRGLTPECAVWQAVATISARFDSSGPLLAARVVDLEAVRDRMIARLGAGPAPALPAESAPYVLVAHDLAATQTAVLDPHLCLAIVTRTGASGSHTAILARYLGIPAVTGADLASRITDGTTVLVDGSTGEVVVNPTDPQRAEVLSGPG